MGKEKDSYTGADALLDALIANGAHTAFGVPGESYLAALDAIHTRGDTFRFISCRHEAGAANMADAAGKLTGAPGICFVTRGPGTTHATIGLHTAYQDSTPLILLIGQVARDQKDREAFQEMNYTHFLSEVTKWTAEIQDANRIAEYIGRAFRVATSGRPGPVALALPEDMLSGPARRQAIKPYRKLDAHPAPDAVDTAARLLQKSRKPFMIVGGSGWTEDASTQLRHFCETRQIPVCASFRAQDRLNNDSPAYVGDMGIGANPALVAQMQESDLLIALGPRLGEMTTAGYSRLTPPVTGTPLIHIHQGAEELGSVYQPDLAVHASPGPFLKALTEAAPMPTAAEMDTRHAWLTRCRTAYEQWNTPTKNGGPVQLARLYDHMNTHLPADTIYANGAGTYSIWLHRFARYRHFPSQLAPTSGAMGYGVPAAVGAKILNPNKTVVALSGDGCFMMGMTEFATACQYQAGVLFLVFNNSQYGSIRMHQARSYPYRTEGTALQNPDFAAVAAAYGAFGARVTCDADFDLYFPQALAATKKGRPALLEITVDPDIITPTSRLSDIEAASAHTANAHTRTKAHAP